jgi:hypothetical protein
MTQAELIHEDLRMRIYTGVAAILAVCAVAMALPADKPAPTPVPTPVVLADLGQGPAGPSGRPHRPRLLRLEYQGYESRLRVMEHRIDEDERYHHYASEVAAQHRQDLAAIRARFHYRDERVRPMSRPERNRFDADLRAQEAGLSIVYRP